MDKKLNKILFNIEELVLEDNGLVGKYVGFVKQFCINQQFEPAVVRPIYLEEIDCVYIVNNFSDDVYVESLPNFLRTMRDVVDSYSLRSKSENNAQIVFWSDVLTSLKNR